jgi:hypothetical protein
MGGGIDMPKNSGAVLRTLNRSIMKGSTKGHLLEGHVSQQDMNVLKGHLDAGTLMSGVTPIADTSSKAAALRNMPTDLAKVVAKLPANKVSELRAHLNTLGRDPKGAVPCSC